MKQEKTSLLRNGAVQSLLASLLCIILGLVVGYIALLLINPAGANGAILAIVENLLQVHSPAPLLRQHSGEDRPPADVQPLGALRL